MPGVWSVDTLPLANHPSLGGTSLGDPQSASYGIEVGKLQIQSQNVHFPHISPGSSSRCINRSPHEKGRPWQ